MTEQKSMGRQFLVALAGALLYASAAWGQAQPAPSPAKPAAQSNPQPPAAAPAAPATAAPAGKQAAPSAPLFAPNGEPYVHTIHLAQFGGTLECSLCHPAVKDGSVELQRPGHDQCMICHSDDFDPANAKARKVICAACHSSTTPAKTDVLPFPRYSGTRALLFRFSHANHVDKLGRINKATGFRADCTFCHKFDAQGVFAKFPGHTECAACHSKPGVVPQLTPALDATGCIGCHTPQEIENPGFTRNRRMITQTAVSGKYVAIKFTHLAHFEVKQKFNLDCTTCHYAIPQSTGLSDLTLPKMVDCVACHDTSRNVPAEFRMTNCQTCHADTVTGLFTPTSHTRNVMPASHTVNFRINHADEAAAPDAPCYVCHLNVRPATQGASNCQACHSVMRPATHTARWKDDLHGKYAAIDRTSCATCHQADFCVRCHNELPRSHEPLPVFAGGGHATLALLDTRACLTCHTFQNTCSECHTNQLTPRAKP
ncbi:MAG TPA: cytochrome c3 family protein [Bryobacteraceae bacterium]|nr:cytochrome c3 family protein [Bryobacteraceae bacterium]